MATRPSEDRARRARRSSALVAMATIALVAATAILIAAAWDLPGVGGWGFRGFAAIFAVAFGGVGFLISFRVPGNPIGALMLVTGLLAAVVALCVEYAAYGLVASPGSLPGTLAVGWLLTWVWIPFAVLPSTFLVLVFPDGRLPSPRWRPVAWIAGTALVTCSIGLAFQPGPITNAPFLENPFGASPSWAPLVAITATIGFVLLAVAVLLSAVALVRRFRRTTGVARQQLKWFAAAAVFAGIMLAGPGTLGNVVFTGDASRPGPKVFQLLVILGFLAIPVATGVAILRYRLYEIDRILSRTIAWSAVTAILGLVFVGGILALQGLLAPMTGGSTLAVAASTLVVAGLAQPIARRVRAAVDRRFFRARYDAALTVDSFASRLRSEVDLDAIRRDVASTVAVTMRPLHAAVWIRPTASGAGSPGRMTAGSTR